MTTMDKIKILLADDHTVLREGIRALLEDQPDMVVIGEAEDGRWAVHLAHELHPDVVLMDVAMPLLNGLEATRQIKHDHPEIAVLVLTMHNNEEYVKQLLAAGVSGYILKQIGSDDLIKALESVGRGEALLDPAVTQRVFQEVRRAVKEEEASAFSHLSQQEKHVLLLVSEGKTNREIAKNLFLGEGTVRNYVSSILSKLGVNNRAEAAAYAVEHNLREYISM